MKESQNLIVRYLESADPDESAGEIVVDHNLWPGRFAYIDAVYRLRSDSPGRISFRCGQFLHTDRVLPGGRRCLSLRVPAPEITVHGAITFHTSVPLDLERTVLREDYYDFFGLRSGRWYDQPARDRDQAAAAGGDSLALCVTLYMVWQCDYRCPYCWQEVPSGLYRNRVSRALPPEAWAEALNRLGPAEIHVSGGEPALYKRLPRLISLMDRSVRLSSHTNFGPSFDTEMWTAEVDPGRMDELSLSFHPTQVRMEEFFGKLSELVGLGWKNLSVAMPLFPANLPYCEGMLRRCADLNVPARFQPYVPPTGHPVRRDRRLVSEMKRWIRRADRLSREMAWNRTVPDFYERDQYWELRENRAGGAAQPSPSRAVTARKSRTMGRNPVFCNAGRRRLVVEDTGDVYTCSSAVNRSKLFGSSALPHYARVGNIFDREFQPLTRPVLCWESFRCGADDFQHLDSAWLPLSHADLDLPLPE